MEKQIVVFELSGEHFGIDIASVEGIVKMQKITRLPQAPDFVEGITNLRGSIIPIINLEKRFGISVNPETSESRIVVTNLQDVKVGMIVAAVTEVLTIQDSIIEPPPPIVMSINTDFIIGVANMESGLIILLDLERVLSDEEVYQTKLVAQI